MAIEKKTNETEKPKRDWFEIAFKWVSVVILPILLTAMQIKAYNRLEDRHQAWDNAGNIPSSGQTRLRSSEMSNLFPTKIKR